MDAPVFDYEIDIDALNESDWWKQGRRAIEAFPECTTALNAMRTASISDDPATKFPPVHDGMQPQTGYFKTRIAPNKDVFLPVRIYYVLRCEVGRYHASPFDEWLHCCKFPISRGEWEDMKGLKSTLSKGGIHARV